MIIAIPCLFLICAILIVGATLYPRSAIRDNLYAAGITVASVVIGMLIWIAITNHG